MNSTSPDDGYASSTNAWDNDDPARLRVSPNTELSVSPHNTSISPLPRSSTDSDNRPVFTAPWNSDGNSLERRDTLATIHSVDQPSLVEPGFDESILRALCDLDVRSSIMHSERRGSDYMQSAGYLFFWTASNRASFHAGSVAGQSNSSKAAHLIALTLALFQEASIFFKKRAVIEEEHGKALQKLARSTAEVYALNDGKAG